MGWEAVDWWGGMWSIGGVVDWWGGRWSIGGVGSVVGVAVDWCGGRWLIGGVGGRLIGGVGSGRLVGWEVVDWMAVEVVG